MLHQVGVGALGPVFRTYEPARDRLVAAKVFRLDITPEQAQALADELARAAEAGLFHPSIVEPIAAGVQGTVAYRAEEYVPAESLDVAMRHYAPATPDKVLPLVTQLAGAIDFARAAGVGHGALHPRDIFVTPDEARVTGFGVVEALERVGLRAPVRRPYSPPERIAGEPWGTPADVFSLAAIAFEMLTARRPSGIGDQTGDIKEPSAGPHAALLRDVLWQGMHEQPTRRFPTALAFAAALEAAARGEREVAAPPVVPVAAAAPVPAKRDEVKTRASESTPAQTMPPPEKPDVSGVRSRFSEPSAPEPAAGKVSSDPTTSGRETPTPGVPEPVAAQVEADDIASELEEDVAHWNLSREEQQQDEPRSLAAVEQEDAEPLYTHEQVEAAGDRLTLDAADLALRDAGAEGSYASEFESDSQPERAPVVQARLRELDSPDDLEPVVRSGRRDGGFNPIIVPPARASVTVPPAGASMSDSFDRPLSLEQSGESRIVVQRPRTAMLPLAVTLILGLLIGFAAGDYVGSRRAAAGLDPGAGGGSGVTPDTTSAQDTGAAPAGKDWTEGSVAQPPATQPPTPAAAAPDVPAEGSPERAAAENTAPAQPPAPTREEPTTGRLVVRSTPAKAGVTVNGRWRGRTPLSLDDLAFGNYVVRVVADGYRTGREELTLSSRNPSRNVAMKLERQAAAAAATAPASSPTAYFGSVFVDSRPQGATVYIGGKQYGKTPVKIPEVPIGSHVVRLELVDHRSWTTSVRVAAGQEVRATGSLEPIR